jgi:predicted NAD/FAD-binding protein
MPRNRTAWSAWNYLDDGSSATTASKKASLTFNLTGLSGYNYDEDGHILTTLNPSRPPDPAKVQGTYNYSPVLRLECTGQARANVYDSR